MKRNFGGKKAFFHNKKNQISGSVTITVYIYFYNIENLSIQFMVN